MSAPRPEYPRPHFDRSHSWQSLNGSWGFHRDPNASSGIDGLPPADAWRETITVPFAWETPASGVQAHWLQRGWYRREFTVPTDWSGARTVLHFGAVHHEAAVWVNGVAVGSHEGGYTPFELDVTDVLRDRNELIVRVDAPADKREIVHGKQRSIPRDDYDSCAFTPTSGIWQPVWMESRPATHITALEVRPSPDLAGFDVHVEVAGPHADDARLRLAVDGAADVVLPLASGAADAHLAVQDPQLWSPTDPHLSTIEATLSSSDGIDVVATASGLRRVEVDGERLLLNGEPMYIRGVLDQGYWPASGMTAPDDDAFVTDLRLAREAGFTLVRKHLKLEDPRFLHHADRLGMLVWAEPASTGRFSAAAAARFEAQIAPMVQRDGNHPSIVVWGLYNEEWGLDWDVADDPAKQHAVARAAGLLRELDTSRPLVDNSGWSHVDTDLVDWHVYDDTPAGWAAKVGALVDDEEPTFPVGLGPGFVVQKHLTVPNAPDRAGKPLLNSEFGGGFTGIERAWLLRWQTLELRRRPRLAGYVYTELYDIEHEMAGIYDADRQQKDTGGAPASESNADTVLIPDLTPLAPGRDIATDDERIRLTVRVSHLGRATLDARLQAVWVAPMQVLDSVRADAPVLARVRVPAHEISDPVQIDVARPAGGGSTRLYLVLVAGDVAAARLAIDVADAAVESLVAPRSVDVAQPV